MIFEARTSQFAVNVDLARPQLKRAIDQIERFAGEDSGQKRAVIVRAVANDPPGDDDLRKRLIGQFQVRVRLVVLQKDVEPRLVLFDQVRFEHERLDLVIDDDKLKIGDEFDQIARLGVEIAARLKVLTDTAAKVFGLADIDDLARRVLVNIDTGGGRKVF